MYQSFNFDDTGEILRFLNSLAFLQDGEEVNSVKKAGDGNMNFVARIITSQRSFIIKQSNDFVQKYPQIAAPIERILTEAFFYKTSERNKNLIKFLPKLLAEDTSHFAIILEDLGESGDFMAVYKNAEVLNADVVASLVQYLNELHGLKLLDFPENKGMKFLNHEHIFCYPFDDNNGLDLNNIQNGLQDISLPYKNNKVLKDKIRVLGEFYLQQGNSLLHGDFYPGSWLKTKNGIKIIDPEFSFLGLREFELGVFIGHLYLSKNEKYVQEILELYKKGDRFEEKLMWGFAGVEIMRRLLGIAQLPVNLTLLEREILLKTASNFVLLL